MLMQFHVIMQKNQKNMINMISEWMLLEGVLMARLCISVKWENAVHIPVLFISNQEKVQKWMPDILLICGKLI